MLKEIFTTLLRQYTADQAVIEELWHEVEQCYSKRKRHYHTVQHLEHLLMQLNAVKGELSDWNTLLFTLFYHDIVYRATQSDNEERSAELAEKRMRQLGLDAEPIARCKAQIMATKSHTVSSDSDTNYFTDADLSILGAPWEVYSVYCSNVRKEYAIYPDFIYNAGRKKVLNHFLTMDRLFKTEYFQRTFEAQAKENIQRELGSVE